MHKIENSDGIEVYTRSVKRLCGVENHKKREWLIILADVDIINMDILPQNYKDFKDKKYWDHFFASLKNTHN